MPEVESDYPKFLKLLADAKLAEVHASIERKREAEAAKSHASAKEAAEKARVAANNAVQAFGDFMKLNKGRAYVVDKIGYAWREAVGFESIFAKDTGEIVAWNIITGETHVPQPEDGPRDS